MLYEELYSEDFNYHINELFSFLNLEKLVLTNPKIMNLFKSQIIDLSLF